MLGLETTVQDPPVQTYDPQRIFWVLADPHHTPGKVCLFDFLNPDMYAFGVHGKTQWLDHTANHLAVACVVELEVAPVEQVRLEADFDVDLYKVVFFAVRGVDGKVHAVSGEMALAPVGGVEDLFDEGDGALPREGVERGVVFEVQWAAD
jgi:hypothetical protein